MALSTFIGQILGAGEHERARRGARFGLITSLLLAYSNCIAGVLRGAGKAFVSMIVMLAIWCVLRIIYITVAMQFRHDIVLLYWAYPITWAISSAIYLVYYHVSDWLHSFEKE